MTYLTSDDLKELDSRIDSFISSLDFFKNERDIATIHILRIYEDYNRLNIYNKNVTDTILLPLLKNGEDAINVIMNWIHKFCPYSGKKTSYGTNSIIYEQGITFFQEAIDYSKIWDFMSLLFQERVFARYENANKNKVIIEYPKNYNSDMDVTSFILGAPDSPDINIDIDNSKIIEYVKKNVPYTHTIISRVICELNNIDDKVFDFIRKNQTVKMEHLWELDEKWVVGDYTIADFRNFWATLYTIVTINYILCTYTGVKGLAINSIIITEKYDSWVDMISKYSSLTKNIVSAILNDLTYDISLYKAGKKQPHVIYQPFFKLNGSLLAVSNWLVFLSNSERNLWDLLSIIKSDVHSRIRNLKEKKWLDELEKKIHEEYKLDVLGSINFEFEDKKSDLDALLIDKNLKFGLGLQLKWLTNPDRTKEVKYTDEALTEGIGQAELSDKWLNSRPDKIRELLNISAVDFEDYEFHVCVMSKNTLGSGWIERSPYPIINERILNWILGDPHKKTLKDLWKVAEEKSYLPKEGKHYESLDAGGKFGDIEFIAKDLGMQTFSNWNPEVDIVI